MQFVFRVSEMPNLRHKILVIRPAFRSTDEVVPSGNSDAGLRGFGREVVFRYRRPDGENDLVAHVRPLCCSVAPQLRSAPRGQHQRQRRAIMGGTPFGHGRFGIFDQVQFRRDSHGYKFFAVWL